jgi:hypothetical protein
MVEIESVLSFNFYTYGKPFTGSDHGKRFRIVKEERELPGEPKEELPDGEEAEVKKENVLAVCIWPEPFAYDKTGEEKKIRRDFPFTEEGLIESVAFINETDI